MKKALIEKRNGLLTNLDSILHIAESDKRAFSTEEQTKFDSIKEEIRSIDATLKSIEDAEKLEEKKPATSDRTAEQKEERAFADYVRGIVSETRANITKTENGAVIPSTIANKIIKRIQEISPLYAQSTRYNIKGNLSVPYYDESTGSVTVSYVDEFTDAESTGGKFRSIDLQGFLGRAFSKLSKSLVNNNSFDIVGFIVNDVSEKFASWIEKELLIGTDDKISGLRGVTKEIVTASANAIVPDELIDLQDEISDIFQAKAIWIMSRKTRTAIRKFKDSDGNYILNKDATAKWSYTLFGKDVYISDNMPDIAAGATAIYYGDMSGLAVKVSEDINIEILREKYAEQHAIGIVGFIEMDSKVENAQKIARLKMKA